MSDIIKNVIDSGRFELVDILKKIDTIWLQGDITEEQRDELVELAREKADISQEVDILTKLEDHEQRLRKLEEGGSEPSDEYPEDIVGHWYYKDDKITFNGKKYICIAPEGQVCTWSPDDYPAYWQLVE